MNVQARTSSYITKHNIFSTSGLAKKVSPLTHIGSLYDLYGTLFTTFIVVIQTFPTQDISVLSGIQIFMTSLKDIIRIRVLYET